MLSTSYNIPKLLIALFIGAMGTFLNAYGQDGTVIINEFNAEGSTAACKDYIELKNLGPKDQDIGCYTLVNDKKAIRIPPGTILKVGQIITISFGPVTCNDISATPTIDLSNCGNCTSAIASSNWFFGHFSSSGSYPLVLLNSTNSPIDAVRTKVGSNLVTPDNIVLPTFNGACTSSTYAVSTNTGSGTIYEGIADALGTNSSLSRSGDGSCTWFKTSAGSARTPGLTNTTVDETSGTVLTVTNSYAFSCTDPVTSSLSFTVSSTITPLTYYYSYVYSQDNVFNESATKFLNQSNPTQTFIDPSPGFYNFLIAPTETSTCGQRTFTREIISPLVTASLTQNYDCIGGTAAFTLTGLGATNIANPSYYPLTATVTNTTSLAQQTVSLSTRETIFFSQLSPGTYSVTITPNSTFACPTPLENFEVLTVPEATITASITIGNACIGASNPVGYATVNITNADPNLFPIFYTLTDLSNSTVVTSQSTNGSTIYFNNLPPASYSLLLDPSLNGCLNSTFSIDVSEDCTALRSYISKFNLRKIGDEMELSLEMDANGTIQEMYLESSQDGKTFYKIQSIPFENKKGTQFIRLMYPKDINSFFRITLIDIYGRNLISPVLKLNLAEQSDPPKPYPNPFREQLNLSVQTPKDDILIICITSTMGASLLEKQVRIKSGINHVHVETQQLPNGNYLLCTQKVSSGERVINPIVKQ